MNGALERAAPPVRTGAPRRVAARTGPRGGVAAASDPRSVLAAWLVALAAGAFAWGGTWAGMARVWAESDKFQHGFAMLPIAAWSAWRIRARLDGLAPAPSGAGLVAVAACCTLWALGALAGVASAMQLAAVGFVGAATWAVLGAPIAAAMVFPLGYAFFAVPLGEGLSGVLMATTADVLEAALRATGIPVVREAFEFELPTGRWSVIEACGGLNYLVAALPLAVLCAWLRFSTPRGRTGFVLLALALALVANWLRAYAVVMLGHLSGMRYGVGFDHLVYGWLIFGALMFGVAWLANRLGDAPVRAAGQRPRVRLAPAPGSTARAAATAGAIVAGVAVAVHAGGASARVEPRAGFAATVEAALGGGEPQAMQPAPRFDGAREVVSLRVAPGTDAYAAYFAAQSQGRELIGYGNTVLARDDRRWKIREEATRTLGAGADAPTVVEYRIREGDRQRLSWHAYVAGGAVRTRPAAVKLDALAGVIAGRGDHAAVIVVTADLDGRAPDAVRADMTDATLRLIDATRRFTGSPDGPAAAVPVR